MQTMVPPSVWSKQGQQEPLEFRAPGMFDPAHIGDVQTFLYRLKLGVIGALLARHLGHNGFGHEARLAWAGFFLRASVAEEDLIRMGEAMSAYRNNRETGDVRRVVESTAMNLRNPTKKVAGGPVLVKLLGEHGRIILRVCRNGSEPFEGLSGPHKESSLRTVNIM